MFHLVYVQLCGYLNIMIQLLYSQDKGGDIFLWRIVLLEGVLQLMKGRVAHDWPKMCYA